MIAHLIFFSAYLPPNVSHFLYQLYKAACFSIFPTDWLSHGFTPYVEKKQENETPKDGWYINDDMQIFIFAFILGLLLIGVLLLAIGLHKIAKQCKIKDLPLIAGTVSYLSDNLFWSFWLAFLYWSYLPLMQTVIYSVDEDYHWNDSTTGFQNLCLLTVFILFIPAPIFLSVLIRTRIGTWRTDEEYIMRFGRLTERLNQLRHSSCYHPMIFCYHRLFMISLAVALTGFGFAQAMLWVQISFLLMLLVHGIIKPYEFPEYKWQMWYVDASIIFCSYFLFAFSAYIPDPYDRYYLGEWFIAFVSIFIAIYIYFIFADFVPPIYFFFKKQYLKYKAAKDKVTSKVEARVEPHIQ